MKLEDKLTMLISSCEAYSDLWENHMILLNENWSDRTIDTVVVTDKVHEGILERASIFNAGDKLEMPQRIKKYLE